MSWSQPISRSIPALVLFILAGTQSAIAQGWSEVITSDGMSLTARHESSAVDFNNMIYFFGGRGERPVDLYDPVNNSWQQLATAPMEMHHFQPVVYDDLLYIVGALTCCYPQEAVIADIYTFDPVSLVWNIVGQMPADRMRGSAGTFLYNDKIYLVGGNTLGHNGGAVAWFDEYNPATGEWRILPDAPNARDHFSVGVSGSKVIAAAGRQSISGRSPMVSSTDVYDFETNTWVTATADIPTTRAGTMSATYDDNLYVIGGESGTITSAHDTVEMYDPENGTWSAVTNMINGRHAGGAAMLGSRLHVFSGSLSRGGGGETTHHETIDLALAETTLLSEDPSDIADTDGDGLTDKDESEIYKTSLSDPDTDNDGLDDGDEVLTHKTNPLKSDTDGDNLDDGLEIDQVGTDPLNSDSDDDGLTDGDEFNTYLTDPTEADSDLDGLDDYSETTIHFTDPLSEDTDGDTLSDRDEIITHLSNPLAVDSDGDGVADQKEIESGTAVYNLDEDGDGIINSVDGIIDTDLDGLPNYADLDSDNDSIPDVLEFGYSDENRDAKPDHSTDIEKEPVDSDLDGLPDFIDLDSDQDGIPDLAEALDDYSTQAIMTDNALDINQDGLIDTYHEHDADYPIDTDGDSTPNHLDLDSDQDGIPDLAEALGDYSTQAVMTDNTSDIDQDGLTDVYYEHDTDYPTDTDDDGIPNHLDPDSDDDGLYDVEEAGAADENNDGVIDQFIDTDGNGISDSDIPLLGKSLADIDMDDIPDLVDSKDNRLGGGSTDLPLFALATILLFSRRRRSF